MVKTTRKNNYVLKEKIVEIPEKLKENINKLLKENQISKVVEDSQILSNRYRNNNGNGKKLLVQKSEAISYAISRMPATYAAVSSVLEQISENYKEELTTMIDVGAGTGAVVWAINDKNICNDIKCLEREESMISIGKQLMQDSELNKVTWEKFDILQDEIKEKADLVITSYMINELPKEMRQKAVEKLWKATNKLLVIIEPGTPAGFANILEIRKNILDAGGYIVAPCCCLGECPISKDDWCAFYARIARSSAHRQAKKGELGYEDEKFSYIAFSKIPVENKGERILRHPQINSGYVKVKVCGADGIQEKTYSKKDKDIYKKVRKMDAGQKI